MEVALSADNLPVGRYVKMVQALVRQGMSMDKALSLVSRTYYLSSELKARLLAKLKKEEGQ